MSPTIIKPKNYRVIIFTNDHPPAHVHVRRAGNEARVGLEPVVLLVTMALVPAKSGKFCRLSKIIKQDCWPHGTVSIPAAKEQMMKDFKLNKYEQNRPIGIRFKDDYVWVTLQDGRTIGNPLEWHPWLAESPTEKLVNVEMSAFSIYWPDLDEGLDVEGMLRGTRSRIPSPA